MSNGSKRPPVLLIVLDGWGYREEREGNAIELAETPVWHRLWNDSPRTLLEASGLAVGLPEGQMGNSEVGHLTLGAGRVRLQDLVRISQSIRNGEFARIEPLVALASALRERGGTLHLVGLLGPGGVHAIDEHIVAAVEMAMRHDVPRVAIQGFLDGRDAAPTLGASVVERLAADIQRIAGPRGTIASLTGRYYGMDRDRRWERTRRAFDALVHGTGRTIDDPAAGVRAAYERGETDEFVEPLVVHRGGAPVAPIRSGDGVFFINYRSDRMRQIVAALTSPGFDGFDASSRPELAGAVTMTEYDRTFTLPQAFPPVTLAHVVGEVLADHGRTQYRVAETEKYPHVTYFFNGGHEPPYAGEERCLIPSQKQVATYDLAPQMSAPGITDALCAALRAREHDFYLCNFANADMVGHTGVLPAVVEAVETVDRSLGRILAAAEAAGIGVIVTADHGNAEMMLDPATGGVHTAHTTNPVPLVTVGTGAGPLRSGGSLRDVGPTVLRLLGLDLPAEMTGRDLREK